MSTLQSKTGTPILVIGATGNVGRHVVSALATRGLPVRVLTRDVGRARELLGEGPESLEGDLTDPPSLTPAFSGVGRVYLATNGGDQIRMETNAIAAAQQAGVQQIVKLSLVDARTDTFVTLARVHATIEGALLASAVDATILRASYFMENFLAAASTIATQGAIYGAAGAGAVAFVDGRDLANAAVATLTEEGHLGKTYHLTGPETLTFAEAAEHIGAALGKAVQYVDLSEEAFRAALSGAGLPPELAQIYAEGHRAVQLGIYAERTTDLARLTAQPPRTVTDFTHDYAAAFRGAAATH